MRPSLKDDFMDATVAFSKNHNEPLWFQKMREEALINSEELSLPVYEKINYRSWRLDHPKNPFAEVNTDQKFDQPETNNLLIQDGDQTLVSKLDPKLAEQGVIFTDIWTAMQKCPKLVQKYLLTKTMKPAENRLVSLNLALMNGGSFLYVPKNVQIKDSIQAVYLQDNDQKKDFFHHVLVVADEGSEVTYLENFLSRGNTEENIANVVVEVVAEDNTHVHFSALDQFGENVSTYLNRHGYVGNNSELDWAIGFMNDAKVVGDFGTDLRGEGSHTEAKVVAITTGEQVQGIDTKVTNYGQHSIGHIMQHGVILQSSTLTFNGVGHIVKGARGSDAQQESRVLMLSRTARGDADPILLIDENDVTAGHAASVGRVNEDQMYYLMSRGIDEKTAQRLVIRGFLSSVIREIPEEEVRDRLTEMIERKLLNGQQD
ncbi:Fe-S cluster assembly protein SufD [Companilactobacillus versmoldensis]|uniref:Iron sulfur ABC transporter n=1 Tax=Companilactobacillus versmoldensis DSM 14857 = KCTC 3814 TaxID=1423815 RepID=A0A0R1SFD3_9LACO|nr:Fe-S cluster assembly protein SufD [Companilactobacillus versmoldensis]KRL67856.1 iron sulfur ABC transporter [Companilactobacillus versmoldensis DSM 14857 = KCTC 3814]